MISFIVILTILVTPVFPFKQGAPDDACSNGTPRHGNHNQQTGIAPFTITAVNNTKTVTVTIKGNSNTNSFKGFLIRAMNGTEIVGKFTLNSGNTTAKFINCGNGTVGFANKI